MTNLGKSGFPTMAELRAKPSPPRVDFRFCRGRGRHLWKDFKPINPDANPEKSWVCDLCGLKRRV